MIGDTGEVPMCDVRRASCVGTVKCDLGFVEIIQIAKPHGVECCMFIHHLTLDHTRRLTRVEATASPRSDTRDQLGKTRGAPGRRRGRGREESRRK